MTFEEAIDYARDNAVISSSRGYSNYKNEDYIATFLHGEISYFHNRKTTATWTLNHYTTPDEYRIKNIEKYKTEFIASVEKDIANDYTVFEIQIPMKIRVSKNREKLTTEGAVKQEVIEYLKPYFDVDDISIHNEVDGWSVKKIG